MKLFIKNSHESFFDLGTEPAEFVPFNFNTDQIHNQINDKVLTITITNVNIIFKQISSLHTSTFKRKTYQNHL